MMMKRETTKISISRNDDEQEFLFSNRNINNCLLDAIATNIVNQNFMIVFMFHEYGAIQHH